MVAKEKKTFVAPLANSGGKEFHPHCFRTHHVLWRSLAFPRREKFIFSLLGGKRGLRKGKFIHPSDAKESSLFLPFLTALEESYKKGGRLRLETCFCFLLRPFSRQLRGKRGEQTLRKAWKEELFPRRRRRRRRREVEGEEGIREWMKSRPPLLILLPFPPSLSPLGAEGKQSVGILT